MVPGIVRGCAAGAVIISAGFREIGEKDGTIEQLA